MPLEISVVVVLAVSVGLALLIPSRRCRTWLARSRLVTWVTGVPRAARDAPLPPALGRRRVLAAVALTAGSQLCDAGCLVAALHAAGVRVPWTVLLLAYGGAQLLGLLPVTPGGAGVLESGLGALLVVPSAAGGSVALAVLIYRSVSWGAWVLGGGLALLRRRLAAGTADAAGPGTAAPAPAARTRTVSGRGGPGS